jgi:hypothetical protein
MARWMVMACLLVALGACASPEARRVRGGGQGADVGNSTSTVNMHEGSDPYFRTKRLIEPYGQTDVESGRQAHRPSSH